MTDTPEPNNTGFGPPCPECHTGVLRLQFLTYFTWLNRELITVPSFPSWVCDVCGRREYDVRAVNWLNTLLNPSTGKGHETHRRANAPTHRSTTTLSSF